MTNRERKPVKGYSKNWKEEQAKAHKIFSRETNISISPQIAIAICKILKFKHSEKLKNYE